MPTNSKPSAGHNIPALTHEQFAKQAVSAMRAGDKQAIKGSHNIIEALLVAHQNGILEGEGPPVTEMFRLGRRQFNLNAIMHRVFNTRERDADGTYYVVGGLVELEREYEGKPIPDARLRRAQENERLDKAIRNQIGRNLGVIALLSHYGGAYHEHERPQGAAMIGPDGYLQISARAWFDDPTRDAAEWVSLDGVGRRGANARTLSALQARAALHYGRVRAGRPRGSRTRAPTMGEALETVRELVVVHALTPDMERQCIAVAMLILGETAGHNGGLDLDKVQALWVEHKRSEAA